MYAPLEQRLVARCQGHSSFVTGVAWDKWRSDERTTRFLSVGEDCKLIVWDLSSAALTRPKQHVSLPLLVQKSKSIDIKPWHQGPYSRRHSAGSTLSLARRRGNGESSAQLPLTTAERASPCYHSAPRRSDGSSTSSLPVHSSNNLLRIVAMLQPQMVKALSSDLFAGLQVLSGHVVTFSRIGQVKLWERPPTHHDDAIEGGLKSLRAEFAASTVNIDSRKR